jgi:hypothetical protein
VAFTISTVWPPEAWAGLVTTAALCEGLADGLPVFVALGDGTADEAGAEASTIGAAPALVFWPAPPEHPTSAATSTPLASISQRCPEPANLPTIPAPLGTHSVRESRHPPANNQKTGGGSRSSGGNA